METGKQNKPGNGLTFYVLSFLVALLFELYWIYYRPDDYFMLFGIGIIVVITGYLSLDTINKIRAFELAERQQQNETMIKAQKAIYLATKKNATEAEKTRDQNIKTLELLMSSMVSSQKELVNVITTKSDEFATKQLTMNDSSADVSELVDKLSKSNEKLAKQVQDAMTINELVKANAELVKSVQGMFNGNSTPVMNTESLNTIPVDNIAPIINPDPILEEAEAMEDIPEEPAPSESAETAEDLFTMELPPFESLDISDDENVDTIGDIEDIAVDTFSNEINVAKMEEEQTLENMTVAEDISPELDNEMSNTTEKDPNAPLTEEEIAALFASL